MHLLSHRRHIIHGLGLHVPFLYRYRSVLDGRGDHFASMGNLPRRVARAGADSYLSPGRPRLESVIRRAGGTNGVCIRAITIHVCPGLTVLLNGISALSDEHARCTNAGRVVGT